MMINGLASRSFRLLRVFCFTNVLFAVVAVAQTPANDTTQQAAQNADRPPQPGQLPPVDQPGVKAPDKTQEGEDKRVLGVLPNYRTAEMSAQGTPLTAHQKLRIAAKDSFDYPLMILGAAYAGVYHLENDHPQFGQGAKGYFSRFGTSYTDQVDGNLWTEGLLPVVLHEDPRYFRMAEGSIPRRAWYSITRILITHTDSNRSSINFAELGGNAIAAGIGLSYYSDDRNVPDYLDNWGTALGTDAASQLLKEFWPDVKRWWYVRHHRTDQAQTP